MATTDPNFYAWGTNYAGYMERAYDQGAELDLDILEDLERPPALGVEENAFLDGFVGEMRAIMMRALDSARRRHEEDAAE